VRARATPCSRMAAMPEPSPSAERHACYRPADADGIGRLLFTRAAKLNATDDVTLGHLAEAIEAASTDPAARAIVVAGEGRAFCVGIDLRALATDAIPDDWFARWDRALVRLEALPTPTVAAVQGPCLGGGLQVALCCDLRVAADDATFGLSAVTHGIVPGLATWRLERFVGAGAARELMLLGETWDAGRGLRHGLVDRVVPLAELDTQARRLAQRIASAPREAVRATKRLTLAAHELSLERFLESYVDAQRRCREDPETQQNLDAYRRGRWGRG